MRSAFPKQSYKCLEYFKTYAEWEQLFSHISIFDKELQKKLDLEDFGNVDLRVVKDPLDQLSASQLPLC